MYIPGLINFQNSQIIYGNAIINPARIEVQRWAENCPDTVLLWTLNGNSLKQKASPPNDWDIEQNNLSNDNSYFQDFKIINNYNIDQFTITGNKIILDKSLFKTYFYKHSLIKFNIKFDNTELYDIKNYIIEDNQLILQIV